MILVGDIHGKFNILQNIIEKNKGMIIQLGDLGIGFPERKINPVFFIDQNAPYTLDSQSYFEYSKTRFRFIAGNHDNPEVCKKHKNYLGDYGIFKDLFYVSGAWSIDQQYRKEGMDWWKDEELSIKQLEDMLDLYEKTKPEIVITHDCPFRILKLLYSQVISTRTGQALDAMLDIHIPNFWYFAHHHKSFTYNYMNKCTIQCLNTNEIKKI